MEHIKHANIQNSPRREGKGRKILEEIMDKTSQTGRRVLIYASMTLNEMQIRCI